MNEATKISMVLLCFRPLWSNRPIPSYHGNKRLAIHYQRPNTDMVIGGDCRGRLQDTAPGLTSTERAGE